MTWPRTGFARAAVGEATSKVSVSAWLRRPLVSPKVSATKVTV